MLWLEFAGMVEKPMFPRDSEEVFRTPKVPTNNEVSKGSVSRMALRR